MLTIVLKTLDKFYEYRNSGVRFLSFIIVVVVKLNSIPIFITVMLLTFCVVFLIANNT